MIPIFLGVWTMAHSYFLGWMVTQWEPRASSLDTVVGAFDDNRSWNKELQVAAKDFHGTPARA